MTQLPEQSPRTGFDSGEYAAGWDAAVWTSTQVERMTLDALADTMGHRAAEFEALAADDELQHPESSAYKAGAAYGYRMAQAAILDTRRSIR